MIQIDEVAKNVRVTLNENWKPKSLSDEMLQTEVVIFISDNIIYTNNKGNYVKIKGGSYFNVGIAYLEELDLELPIKENRALYGTSSSTWRQSTVNFLLAEKEKIERKIAEIDEKALLKLKNSEN